MRCVEKPDAAGAVCIFIEAVVLRRANSCLKGGDPISTGRFRMLVKSAQARVFGTVCNVVGKGAAFPLDGSVGI